MSRKKWSANRRNARHSTGPRTDEGKVASSQNAVTHGMFCHRLVLAGEDLHVFNLIHDQFIAQLAPSNILEMLLTERIVIATWKLMRLQDSESIQHGYDDRLYKEMSAEQSREFADAL